MKPDIEKRIRDCHYSLPDEDVEKIKQLIADCIAYCVPEKRSRVDLKDIADLTGRQGWNLAIDEMLNKQEELGL